MNLILIVYLFLYLIISINLCICLYQYLKLTCLVGYMMKKDINRKKLYNKNI